MLSLVGSFTLMLSLVGSFTLMLSLVGSTVADEQILCCSPSLFHGGWFHLSFYQRKGNGCIVSFYATKCRLYTVDNKL